MAVVEIGLLGPVEVRVDGCLRALQRPQHGMLLAALAVDAGRPVPVDTILDRVWGEAAPANARRTVHSHVSRIRRLVACEGQEPLVRRPGGYQLDIAPLWFDLHRFRSMVGQARGGCRDRVILREALALWRGEPLGGLSGDWVDRVRRSWRQEHLDAVVAWAQAELAAGDPQTVVALLTDLSEEHPLLEPLWAGLVAALYACGRKADALSRFATLQRRLAVELGAEPATELQDLHRAMLRDEPIHPVRLRFGTMAPVTPAQLPADVRGFTGRGDELARLDAVLAGPQSTEVAIAVVSGTAGAGKTALAVHWAHRVADRFPDGQLFVNLRGFEPGGVPLAPAEAVRGLLDALGVPLQQLPADLDAQAGLYRSLLAGKRLLVVLDNARDAAQVRPLLPAAPGCSAIVTSRNQLTGLVVREAAIPLRLDLLPVAEARELLVNRLGEDRVAVEPAAADEIITRCAGLPLALVVVAARATSRPQLALADFASELNGTPDRLDAFDTDDRTADIRTVFSWSYQHLSGPAAGLFRLLGLHPGPDIAIPAAASLAGVPPPQARTLLDELCVSHLLIEHRRGRYTVHDLLRAYAAELVNRIDPERRRTATVRRMLDHYLHAGYAAARLLDPNRDRLTLRPAPAGTTAVSIADHQQALAWLATERPVLVAAVGQALATGWDTHAWQLAWTVSDLLHRQGRWSELATTQRASLAAAQRLGDVPVQVRTHTGLARAYGQLSRFDDVVVQLRRALDLARRSGDQVGQANTWYEFSLACGRVGRYDEALEHAQKALDLYRETGHRRHYANSLSAIGWLHAKLGYHEQAIARCEEALARQQENGDQAGEAATWHSLGYARYHLDRHDEAITCYQRSLELRRHQGDLHGQALVLTHLGDCHAAASNPAAARAAWEQALAILDQLDHPDTIQISARLAAAVG